MKTTKKLTLCIIAVAMVMSLAPAALAAPEALAGDGSNSRADITADFKDPNFLEAVRESLGKAANAPIYDTDVSNLTWLSVSYRGITSLAGLEHFASLEDLFCSGNMLTELPALPKSLEWLYCSSNMLTELPALPGSLELLGCSGNMLTELPALPGSLEELYCSNNKLTELPALPGSLEDLDCSGNMLTELPALPSSLKWLVCYYNQITEFDVTGLSGLQTLWCYSNCIESPDSVKGWQGLSLTINSPENTGGGTFLFYPQRPARTDITADFKDSLFLAAVREILGKAVDEPIYNADVSSMGSLFVSFRGINSLAGLEHFTSLEMLYCSNNVLTKFPALPENLKFLYCSNNMLTELPALPSSLELLVCYSNHITEFDVTGLSGLQTLQCYNNYMESPYSVKGWQELGLTINSPEDMWGGTFLFYPQRPARTDITADFKDPQFLAAVREILGKAANEPIYDTDVSDLWLLSVSYRGITSLAGLEHFTSLDGLDCSHNQITELPALPSGLTYLNCANNMLTELPALPESLEYLYCSSNMLTELPALPSSLKWLGCYYNQITEFDVTGLSGLQTLWCYSNYIESPDSVKGWQGLSLTINSPENTGGGTFRFYPQYPVRTDVTADFKDPHFLAAVRERLGKAADEPVYDTDVSDLTWLSVSFRGITSLAGLEHFTSLEDLDCSNNMLTELPALPGSLEWLDCPGNMLTELPALPESLEYLDCSSNMLTELPALPSGLTFVFCYYNLLTEFDVTGLIGLQRLWCYYNYIESPDSVKGWRELDIAINSPEDNWRGTFLFYPQYPARIDVTADFKDPHFFAAVRERLGKAADEPVYDTDVSDLTWLSVSFRGITSLAGLEHFASLGQLSCSGNMLTELPALPSGLKWLDCSYNQITELPALPSGLLSLDCPGNRLTALPALPENMESLFCFDNSLIALPPLPPGLRHLSCFNNQLAKLDISSLASLEDVSCRRNLLTGLALNSFAAYRRIDVSFNYMANEAAVTGKPVAWDGDNFIFSPQLSPVGSVVVGIHAPDASYVGKDAEFSVSLANAANVLSVELAFECDGGMLVAKSFTGRNGFEATDVIRWAYLGDNLWKGSLALGYMPGNDSASFSSIGLADIASIVFTPKTEGETALALSNVKVAGKNGVEVVNFDAVAEPSTAMTAIEWVYSRYDLTRDGIVDALDLGIMLLYCGFDKDSPQWGTYVKANDSKGKGVTAKTCDVNGDGVIDMLDLLDLIVHFGSAL